MYINGIQANLAQLVEQLIRNEQVIGSSPIIGSIFLPFFGPFLFVFCISFYKKRSEKILLFLIFIDSLCYDNMIISY